MIIDKITSFIIYKGVPSILFDFPHFPAQFELPDDWWDEAGMRGFVPAMPSFPAARPEDQPVDLAAIAPPHRLRSTPKDFRGLDRDRMIRVLRGIAQGTALPAVALVRIPHYDAFYAPHPFGLVDGVHRFFASVAAGFVAVPATIREPFL